MAAKKRVLLVMPTDWDAKQLPACRSRWQERFEPMPADPSDHDCPWDFDLPAYIAREASEPGRFDGLFSSSDYPGATTAAAIATRLGLPGPDPQSVIGASHKYYSRIAQREAAPEATARFGLIGPRGPIGDEPLVYPCFIKPVKGAFSILSERLDDRGELEAFLKRPSVTEFLTDYVFMFNRLVAELTTFEIDGSHFIAEELLTGKQVTLEGFVAASPEDMGRLGIVDSIRHPRTKSFIRFDYPTSLPRRVQERMWDVASRVVRRLGLKQTLFNIELMYDGKRDRISIVEVNPRMCGQFADLYEKVDNVNSYEIALALAVGESPVVTPGEGEYDVAASYPLRIFEPSRVLRAPSPDAIDAATRGLSQTLVWSECETNDVLSDFEAEDGKSARYAVVNLGARDRDDLRERIGDVVRKLDFRFEPVV